MFLDNKRNELQQTIHELQVENERLKIEKETNQFKLDQMKEKITLLEEQLKQTKSSDVEKLKSENESLKKKISDLEFKISNDTSQIEISTENAKLKAQIDVYLAENKHLKKLLDTYREMPDVKNMIDSLSGLAVPHIDQLKDLVKIIDESKISKICDDLNGTLVEVKKLRSDMEYEIGRSLRTKPW